MVPIRRSRPDDPAASALLEGLAGEYARLYGERTEGELSSREIDDFLPPRGAFLLAGDVACGAIAPLGGGAAEVKRMWTQPGHRRRGLAMAILKALESEAAALGYRVLRLQTGAASPAAITLYRAAGYYPIAPFGRYRKEPLARAFEKKLVTPRRGLWPWQP